MDTEKNVKDLSLLLAKRSGGLISFVGFSFLILGFINFYFKIPSEYVISVSFAAFFFVCADFVAENKPITKKKLNFYTIFLFLGVFSFVVIPAVSSIFPNVFKMLLESSESLSIISLGLVLIIINYKMWDSEDAFYRQILETAENSNVLMKQFLEESNTNLENLEKNLEKINSELDEDKQETK